MTDMMKPSPALLCKLASLVVHAAEAMSSNAHSWDITALRRDLRDPEVRKWCEKMIDAAMAPMPRSGKKMPEVAP